MMPKREPRWIEHFPRGGTGEQLIQRQAIEALQADNTALKKAGSDLAAAALRVVSDYDGLHRLMLATAAWAKAIADEGGRGFANLPKDAPQPQSDEGKKMKPRLTVTQDSVNIKLEVEGDWEQAFARLLANYSVAEVSLVRHGYSQYDGYHRDGERPILSVNIELREPPKRPKGCDQGCPPNTVCDYCKGDLVRSDAASSLQKPEGK
jgi:hypothetical protein